MPPESVLGIIPARYASSRFPGKPLALLHGQSLIRRVYEQVSKAAALDRVVVATDDPRIQEEVESFGGEVCMTGDHHLSGTDRCAEVARSFPGFPLVINIQGDEPFIQPEQIQSLANLLHGGASIATLAHPITERAIWQNPNVVKVIKTDRDEATYFSRSSIPFLRNQSFEEAVDQKLFFQHVGIYGFKRETLLRVSELPPHPLEQAESLEQLRWLANGFHLKVGVTQRLSIGIDTPEDLVRANAQWEP